MSSVMPIRYDNCDIGGNAVVMKRKLLEPSDHISENPVRETRLDGLGRQSKGCKSCQRRSARALVEGPTEFESEGEGSGQVWTVRPVPRTTVGDSARATCSKHGAHHK